MKQKTLLLFTFLFTAFLASCSHTKDINLTTIEAIDIESITLLSLLPGNIMQIHDTNELNQLITTIQSLPLHQKIKNPMTFDESLVQYTLQGNDNNEITISIQSPYVCINDNWYLSDFTSCEQLNEKANELFH
ncbi:hypothetical protein [Lachnoclostridium phytofermentans]|uniref:Lipoprotein n=1 Tax=Lachnoclostridium phytofermentans (strain ATCC 700394 / DSM 18823 / ISDg) TaxID=357809 RepID=A9KJW0_LACP7|nr:hypothetical protein [Lachnoclostridium phytofermentans]ABX41115.1 hypothetical protein Cphy_0728 [Lachnoclostridium phytofermentans ISDg]